MMSISIVFSFLFIYFSITASYTADVQCPAEKDANVLIFGAGASGIAAAKTLYDNGITDVIVLEARNDSIGGRVRNTEFGGVQVELGSYWIQGIPVPGEDTTGNSTVNPLWTLANDPTCFPDGRLQGKIDDFINVVYDRDPSNPNGSYIDATASFDELSEKYDAIVAAIEAQLQSSPDTPDISVRDALQRNGWKKENYNNTELFNLVEWYGYDFCFAKSPDGSSLRWTIPTLTYAHFGGGDFLVSDQRGLVSLLKCAAKNITQSRIQLGRLVTDIEWSDECVCASVKDTKTGTVNRMCGNYGIYTFSLGVLQDWANGSPSKFKPSLPLAKVEAINYNRMAYYLTVFLEFPERFWDTDVGYILRTDPSVRGRYPLIQRLDDRLPGNPNMLLVHITGEEALRLGNGTNTDNETAEEIMIALRRIYNDSIPDPTSILIPSWIPDPLYRGMYSYFRAGYTEEMHAELIKPEGRLYISGDHTDRDYHSFYHGAYLSGERAANDVIQRRSRSSGAGMIKAGGIVSLLIFQLFVLLTMIN